MLLLLSDIRDGNLFEARHRSAFRGAPVTAEHPPLSNATQYPDAPVDDLAAEARYGEGLARALVEHVCRMRAAGYANDVVLEGDTWGVEVKRKARVS